MKLSVLGGGNEVGASCLHIEIEGTKILIDAGMRMHAEDALPLLGMLEELGGVDLILVTHAHADHIGALPIVHFLYPQAPIYATPPTLDLMRIMMKDSYRILETKCKLGRTLPPYTEEQVESLLSHILHFPASGQLRFHPVNIQSYQAGHILGAVMFGIEAGGETLLVTGDLSFQAGRTIPGAKVLHGLSPDVVVMESTYGNRMHIDRHSEEKRLADNVAEVVASGGFALIPAFALGRAQEILLILQDYMEKGLIPAFPIYVDGLVTPISQVYRNYPHFLKGPVNHRIRTQGDVFLTEGRCIPVQNVQHREQILQSKPACIVASSGMLIGGASSWFAERLISNEKNAIFITGYQDEESPGRKLLALAEGEQQTLELNGVHYPVHCRVDKYGLSAHADAREMVQFIETLSPSHTLLVHGDAEARSQLAERIHSRFDPILVENGETYSFEKRKSGKGITGKKYRIAPETLALQAKVGAILIYREEEGKALIPVICTSVNAKASILYCQTLAKGDSIKATPSQIVEKIGHWNESIGEVREQVKNLLAYSRPWLQTFDWSRLEIGKAYDLKSICHQLGIKSLVDQIAAAFAVLALPPSAKSQDDKGIQTYTLTEDLRAQLRQLALPIQAVRQNPAQAMEAVREFMSGTESFIKCGVEKLGMPEEHILLHFDFPDAILDAEREIIANELRERTGWPIRFSDTVRQNAIAIKLASLLNQPIVSSPSYHREKKLVILEGIEADHREQIAAQFWKETGLTLQFDGKGKGNDTLVSHRTLIQPDIAKSPMETNKAMQEAKQWASRYGITLYKTGIRKDSGDTLMELHFITPQVAERYTKEMFELSERIGMPVTFAPQPKQNEILRVTTELIPPAWGMIKNPSLHMDKGIVTVKLTSLPTPEELAEIKSKILDQTGYELEIKQ